MNGRNLSFSYVSIEIMALLVAVVGIVVQILSGVDYPPVPPGIVILLVAAGLVAFTPWRWSPLFGVAVGLFLIVGFAASGALGNLTIMGELGVLVGMWIQFLAVIVAAIVGLAATVANFKTRVGEAG